MKSFKKLVVLMALILVVGSLSACAPKDDPNAGNNSATVDQISIGGAGTSGTFYIMAAGISDIINKSLGINSVAEVTGGSVENLKLIEQDKIEMGVSQLDVVQSAVQGINEFETPVNLTAVVPMYPNLVQIVTLEGSGIETFSDLKGKKVSVGSPGSGILATNEIILETLGLSMEDIKPEYLSFGETTDAFRDNLIDAAIVNTAAPASWIVDLSTTHKVKFIELSAEEIDKFTETSTFYVDGVISKDDYDFIEEDIPTFAVWIALISQAELPEDSVYDVVKAIFENHDLLKDVHAVAKYVTLENVQNIKGVPFHPGAIKYFNEQGIEVPAN